MVRKILLIDDENDFTEIMSTLLGFHDFEVDAFNDPASVEEAIQKKQYDLIVTDLMMPNIDGFQLIGMVKQQQNYQNVPVIVLSAKSLTDEERKYLLQNNAHFLMKPFEPQGLVDQITHLLAAPSP